MKFIHSDSGNSLIEFALMLPILCFIVLGAANYSLRIQAAMTIVDAATAGAAFGAIPGNQNNLWGMQNTAMQTASGLSGMTITATQLWSCTPGGSPVTSSANCPGYGTPIQYVQVAASASVPALFSWPGVSATLILHENVTYRVPWTQ